MNKSKTARCCLRVVIAGWGAALTAHAVTTTDFSRYQVILDRNPFGEIVPIVVPGAAGPALCESFAKDYEMKAIIDDGDKIQVCVLDKKTKKHIYLGIGQEISGMQLVSVNYDKEEAMLQMDTETAVIKLHPDKNIGAAPAMARAPGLPSFGRPRKNMTADNAASPFSLKNKGSRRPFFSDMQRRGTSPFRRMHTNAAFQSKSLKSFFKPNTNITTPFVSPFRPQASPFKPVSAPDATGQENPGPTLPFTPAQTLDQGAGATAAGQLVAQPANPDAQMQTSPNQGYQQTPIQPAISPFTLPVIK